MAGYQLHLVANFLVIAQQDVDSTSILGRSKNHQSSFLCYWLTLQALTQLFYPSYWLIL